MDVEFDPEKNDKNIAERGLSFTDFNGFDCDPAVRIDDRVDYGDTRYRAFGRIEGKPYCIVYTRRGDTMRLISFRRAHEREMRLYE